MRAALLQSVATSPQVHSRLKVELISLDLGEGPQCFNRAVRAALYYTITRRLHRTTAQQLLIQYHLPHSVTLMDRNNHTLNLTLVIMKDDRI